jgi:hypothetical protein
MRQERLFRLAVESGSVSFMHFPGKGWQVSLRLRRGDETWDEASSEIYCGLTTVELLDVIAAHLDSNL